MPEVYTDPNHTIFIMVSKVTQNMIPLFLKSLSFVFAVFGQISFQNILFLIFLRTVTNESLFKLFEIYT